MTILAKYKAILKLEPNTEVPHHVWRCFGHQQKIVQLVGTDICLGEDYVSMEEARSAVAWYVEQLGGKVFWDDL